MKRFFLVIVFILISSFNFPQSKYTIQVNAGMISPLSSSDGLFSMAQFNYQYSSVVEFYFNTGFGMWDKRYAKYHNATVDSRRKTPEFTKIYYEDEHHIVPAYLGSRITFNTVPLFKTFVEFELGYSYLNYSKYDYNEVQNSPEEGDIAFVISNRQKVSENLFGVGFGLGLAHPMTENINLIIAFKLNSFLNRHYNGLFSNDGTYNCIMRDLILKFRLT